MNTEFVIDINGIPTKAYMQIGFFDHGDISYPLHKHLFSEIHIFLSGNAVLSCVGKEIELVEGNTLCVPADMEHKYHSFSKDSKRITFLIDRDCDSPSPIKTTLPKEVFSLHQTQYCF